MFRLLSGRRKQHAKEPAAPQAKAQPSARFAGGRNIALRLPVHQFEATLAFYRDTLLMPVEIMPDGTPVVEFGDMRLWLDRSETMSQAEIWLEIVTDDIGRAAAALARDKVVRCDGVEKLPAGFRGLWVVNPAGIVHLVAEPGQDGGDQSG